MRAIAVSALLAFAAATFGLLAAAEGVQLTGDELMQSVSGKTYTGRTSRGGTWEATYAPDGTFKVRVLNSDWNDAGTWEVEDNRICSERSKRARMCYDVMRVSADEYHWVDERGQTSKSSGPK